MEKLRAHIVMRITRWDRQVYVVRAVTATGHGCYETLIETGEDLPLGQCSVERDAPGCRQPDGSPADLVTVAGGKWLAKSGRFLERGESTFPDPPGEKMWGVLHKRASALRLSIDVEHMPGGGWALHVQTSRGKIVVPAMPGEDWPEIFELAGLGARV